MIAIRIADPQAMAMNGQYVAAYDPSRPGRSPEGYEMTALIEVTDDPAHALQFPTLPEAMACYRRSHGWREDGEPNRPLTAFTIQIVTSEPLPKMIRVEGVCPFLTCANGIAHTHFVCPACEAVRFGNLFCDFCRTHRHMEVP